MSLSRSPGQSVDWMAGPEVEACHARPYPHLADSFANLPAPQAPPPHPIATGFGSRDDACAPVGGPDHRERGPRHGGHAWHDLQLEEALARWAAPLGPAAPGRSSQSGRGIPPAARKNRARGSAAARVRLHPVDGGTAVRILGPKDRRSDQPQVGEDPAPAPWHRLATDQAHDPQPPRPGRLPEGPRSHSEAKKGVLEPGAPYELWFGDGVRFDLLPVPTCMYRRRGKAKEIPTPGKNLRVGVWGALRWPDGPFVFSHREGSVVSELFIGTLQKLRARTQHTHREIILVRDNGPETTSHASRAETQKVRPQVMMLPLPRYTSTKLNDLENVWKHLKEDYFSRMLVNRPKQFSHAVVDLLGRMRPRPTAEPKTQSRSQRHMSKKSTVPA